MLKRVVITLTLGVAFFAFLIPNVNAIPSHFGLNDKALHADALQSSKTARGIIKSSGHYDHSQCLSSAGLVHHLIFHTSFTEATTPTYHRPNKLTSLVRSNSEETHGYTAFHFGQFPIAATSKIHSTFPETLNVASHRLKEIRTTVLLI